MNRDKNNWTLWKQSTDFINKNVHIKELKSNDKSERSNRNEVRKMMKEKVLGRMR